MVCVPSGGRGLQAEVCTKAQTGRGPGASGPCLVPPPCPPCADSTDSGSGVAAMTVSCPHLPGLAGRGRPCCWEERGRGGNCTRPGPGGQRLGRPQPHGAVLPCPGPGDPCLSTHLRAVCPAEPGLSLGSPWPPPPRTWLQVSAPGFSGVSGPGGLGASCFPLVSSDSVCLPHPMSWADLGGGRVSAPTSACPGCPWWAARTPPSPPRGVVDCPHQDPIPAGPRGPLASPHPRLGALEGRGVREAWVPLVLPESGA